MDVDVYSFILIFLCALIIPIGLFGNLVSIFIFNDKDFRKQPPSFYFIATCFVNIIIILGLPFYVFISIKAYSDLSCQIITLIAFLLATFQSFLVGLSSLDRVITVFKPFSYLFKNKYKFQVLVLLVTLVVLAVLITPAIYFFHLEITNYNQTFCVYSVEHQWVATYIQVQFLSLRTTIPLIIMIISSSLIFWKIRKDKRKLRVLNQNQKRAQQLGISLIVSDSLFLLCRLPNLTNILFNSYSSNAAIFSFLNSIFSIASALHAVFSFIVFLIFNKVYRDLFIKLMKKIKKYFKINNQVGVA